MKRIKFLNSQMDIATMDETVAFIEETISKRVYTQHTVVNVAKLINMRHDKRLFESVSACDLINIDGMGVVYGARFLGHKVSGRVTGIDLFMQLLKLAEKKGYSIYLLGARKGVLTEVVKRISSTYPNLTIVGFNDGYFWGDELRVVEDIKASGAQLLFVGISSPLKEIFLNKWRDRLGASFVMGVGGSFDVIAGKVNRAPDWMQHYGLEWFYRVIQEPRRLLFRYIYTNTVFVLLLIKEKLIRLVEKVR